MISWTLPTNAGESMVVVVPLLAGFLLLLTPVIVLWVNMITAITLGLTLAFELTEAGTMARPPRLRSAPILSEALVWHVVLVTTPFIIGVFAMFSYALDRGYSMQLAQTIAMNTLIVLKIFHLFFIRDMHGTSLTWDAVRGTRAVWLVVVIVAAAQFAVTYLQPAQAILGTEAMARADWPIIVAVEKQIRLGLLLS